MNLSDLNTIINIVQTIVLAILSLFSYTLARMQRNKASIEELEQRDQGLSERLTVVEERLKGHPELTKAINQIGQRLANIEGQLSGIKSQERQNHDLIKQLYLNQLDKSVVRNREKQ